PGSSRVNITKSLDDLVDDLCQSTGTRSSEVAIRIADQVSAGLVRTKPPDAESALIQGISAISEMAPQNLIASMLGAQMLAVNDAGSNQGPPQERDHGG